MNAAASTSRDLSSLMSLYYLPFSPYQLEVFQFKIGSLWSPLNLKSPSSYIFIFMKGN